METLQQILSVALDLDQQTKGNSVSFSVNLKICDTVLTKPAPPIYSRSSESSFRK